jgi:cell volume regulation protein A
MDLILNNYLLVGSFILLLSILLSKSSERFGLPILVVFMFIGMLAGSEGVGGIYFENYNLTHSLSLIALCLIIFSGGVESKLVDIKDHLFRGSLLSSLGIIVMSGVMGGVVYLISGLGVMESLLIGAILSATDAAAVFSMFKDRSSQVLPGIKNLLKLESGSNDPMAYLLVSLILGYMEGGGLSHLEIGLNLILNPLFGFICGFILARGFISLNNIINLSFIGLYPALTLSFIFLSYTITSELGGNGFLAVYVFGVIISSRKILHKSFLFSFYDGVSWISQIGLFVMLGLLVFPSRLISVIPTGSLIAVFLIFLARPITVFACLAFSKFSFKEKVFIAWAGLKGATPIVFASMAAVKMGEKANIIFDIVFFVVLISALLQGLSLKWLARKLGLVFESVEDPQFPIDMEVMEKTRNGIKEVEIRSSDYSVGRRIVDLFLPKGSLVLFIKRSGSFIVPDGGTKFETGDRVLIVTRDKDDIVEALNCFQMGEISSGSTFRGDLEDIIH